MLDGCSNDRAIPLSPRIDTAEADDAVISICDGDELFCLLYELSCYEMEVGVCSR